MTKIIWLNDKEKDGEIFSNSYCLTYCLKFFTNENKIELWGNRQGFQKTFSSFEEADLCFQSLKTLTYLEIKPFLVKYFDECVY